MSDALASLRELTLSLEDRSLNEADTRHKIIDVLLHQILAWPRNRVSCEEHVRPGFADYILKTPRKEPLLLIEAKKSGQYFTLPHPPKPSDSFYYVKIQTLLTEQNIREAMTQARTYCIDIGCEYAAITNGHEWIFFKIFEKTKRWEDLNAFAIRHNSYFWLNEIHAKNNLSFASITERSSLPSLLTSAPPKDRAIYYAKDKISSYEHAISSNRLAVHLRPLITKYFGVIDDDDQDFMESCYVVQRDYKHAIDGMHALIQDSLSPYLTEFGIQQLDASKLGGKLGERLLENARSSPKGEVLVLFGGKGSGKSTFIKRLLHHTPPPWLEAHSRVAILDLLKVPENQEIIRDTIWTKLVDQLDSDHMLSETRERLLTLLFKERFKVASRQDLFGLAHHSEAYNTKLNDLVANWKADRTYCAKALAEYWRKKQKGVIVVLDNTDQYSGPIQDFCFSSAQEISSLLGCMVIISMREERFYNSKIHGVLDAFQNSGFHISSPRPSEVFLKRLSYVDNLLKRNRHGVAEISSNPKLKRDCKEYLSIIGREFKNENSPLKSFLTACAHGDTRLSLDLFRSFLLSGYTNVEEMLDAGGWTFQPHQVIKPIMVPDRYFYEERLSEIPNVFQLRDLRNSSHFTCLRILRRLSKNVDKASDHYASMAELKSYFVETFNMLADFESNINVLLKTGSIEANNRLDAYSEAVDSVKITSYGLYIFKDLAYQFTYVDLICTDCGVFDEETSNYLLSAARDEYNLFTKDARTDRVKTRLDRVEQFLKYLEGEERRERDLFRLDFPDEELFTFRLRESFDADKARILSSAQRNAAVRLVRGNRRR